MYAEQSTIAQSAATTAAGQRTFPPAWLKEHDKDTSIALLAALSILVHLLLRYVWHVGALDIVPLYVALAAGGRQPLARVARQAVKLGFWRVEVGGDFGGLRALL